MRKKIDFNWLVMALKEILMKQGALSTKEMCSYLGISQPVFSRVVKGLEKEILVVGQARATRYFLLREIPGVGTQVPVYQIGKKGKAIKYGMLYGVYPKGFYLKSYQKSAESRYYEDLPYFLDDLLPSGFLGRLIPKTHPELSLPSDICFWSIDHHLKYLTRFGWDTIGDFILGDEAFNLYLKNTGTRPNHVASSKRSQTYPKLAKKILEIGIPGSSAGGEQPKFLTTTGTQYTPVIVKFSPVTSDKISQRIVDLLVCEHIGHQILFQHGYESVESRLVKSGKQVFLEIKRFDRTPSLGRCGLISLKALDLEFSCKMKTWTETSNELLLQNIISNSQHQTICFLETFGEFIGNSDMHLGNISFFSNGENVLDMAPVYDMLPMMYAPVHNQLVERKFLPPLPQPANASVWIKAWHVACDFWDGVNHDSQISNGFKRVAKENLKLIGSMRHLHGKLPV